MRSLSKASILLLTGLVIAVSTSATAETNPIHQSRAPFLEVEKHLTAAIKKNKMGLVSKASATHGAKSIGVTIKGNRVFGVFHPKFAVRMLEASVAAGIEAPVRIYLYENDDGTASITYKKPTTVFGVYGSKALMKMAGELDVIFANIIQDTLHPQ